MAKKGKRGAKMDEGQRLILESYTYECYAPGTLRIRGEDLDREVSDYDEHLEELQQELFRLQTQLFLDKRRAALVFEGWDAAGKGGTIKRLTAEMDPRGYKVWPISAPRDAESRHHYLWRFWQRMPEQGELAVFDRSWYGRVLVERVEGFAKAEDWQRAYDEINAFEKMLTDDGVRMVKFFLNIDKKTQLARFKDREKDAVKNYKLGPDDWRNRAKWNQYERAIQDMLDRTHRPDAPWHVVPANNKQFARLEVMRIAAKALRP